MRTRSSVLVPVLLLLVAVLAWPSAPRAHGYTPQIEQHGAAWAVRLRDHDGKPLALATYVVLRPGPGDVVQAGGETSADGWVVFAPDAVGEWRVRIVHPSGHGAVVPVEVTSLPQPPPPQAAATSPHAPAQTGAPAGRGVARTVGGAAVIAGVFGALWLVRRRRAQR